MNRLGDLLELVGVLITVIVTSVLITVLIIGLGSFLIGEPKPETFVVNETVTCVYYNSDLDCVINK